MQLEITIDQAADIVVESLKQSYVDAKYIMEEEETLSAILKVLEFYLPPQEYVLVEKELKG